MILYKDVLLEILMIIKNVLYVKVVIIWKEDKIVQKIYDINLLNYYLNIKKLFNFYFLISKFAHKVTIHLSYYLLIIH